MQKSDAGLLPQLEGYKRPTLVGRGAFGMVYKAVDATTGQLVAIKVLIKECGPPLLKRFKREANTLAQLQSPHLIRLLDMRLEAMPPWYVMEWVPAGTLATQKPPKTPAHPARARQVARELLSGVGALHAVGLVHRDIKPQNVLVREDGSVVLGDLGLVGEEHASTISETGSVLGTPRYMPPEVLVGKRWTPAGDMFGAGITLWEYAVGQHPAARFGSQPTVFLNPNLKLPSLEDAGGYANPGLERLIHRLLALDAEARPVDAAAAIALLGPEPASSAGDDAAMARWVPGKHAPDEEVTDQFSHAMTQARPGITGTGTGLGSGRGPGDPASPTRPDAAKRRLPGPGGAPTGHPAGTPRRVMTSGAAAAGLALILGAGAWLLRPAAGPGTLIEGPSASPTPSGLLDRFPEGWRPDPPRIVYLEGGQVELGWTTPAQAFARGTLESAEGIFEIPRSRLSTTPALRVAAPVPGAPPARLSLQLVDVEGGTVDAPLDSARPLRSLPEAVETLLAAASAGDPAARIEALFAPLAGLFGSGSLGSALPDREPKVYAALALIEQGSSLARDTIRARIGLAVLDNMPARSHEVLALQKGELPVGRAAAEPLRLVLRLGADGDEVQVDLRLGAGVVVRVRESEAAVVELAVPARWVPPDQLEYKVETRPGTRQVEEMWVLK